MSENKKYFWLKLKEDFFNDDTIEWIEEQENGKEYCLFYLKLCLKSLKTNGLLIRNVGEMLIPYDVKKLAEITNTSQDTVRVAMEIFKNVGLIQILDNGEIYLTQLSSMVGSETNKAQLMRNKRAREKKQIEAGNNVTPALPNCYTEIEIEKEIDIELEKEKELERIDYQKVVNMYNDTCVSFPRIRTLSENRKKAIRARIHQGYTYDDIQEAFTLAEQSSFLKGGNDRNWSATFDWIMKDANLTKILEGNYNDRVITRKPAQPSGNPFLDKLREAGEI